MSRSVLLGNCSLQLAAEGSCSSYQLPVARNGGDRGGAGGGGGGGGGVVPLEEVVVEDGDALRVSAEG